ncbi:metalloprotease secretion protein [Limnohabitans sp. MORI2]|uniref:HlyD family type I secretion periplasmic adaptor subunit n=1 Tax=Limnohabitans sp. MORI2 TaxID=1751150 RepID=UPI002376D883|nr:HlyD family type I secretion periplasmic adaptor subunit [Limnohabitans sp. MORI2]BDU58217.1 metalloprotease secretion protein [Limnohabitans sp. MORI2]
MSKLTELVAKGKALGDSLKSRVTPPPVLDESGQPLAIQPSNTTRAIEKAKEVDQKLSSWIDTWNPYTPEKLADKGLQPVQVEESDIRRGAAKWFMGFFAVFLAWALFAPIDAGVTVQGSVSVLGNRKAIQHPTGGVVQEIMVKEGAQVEAGEVLLRINPLKSEAEMTGVELQYINLLATESRLKAERDAANTITWTDELGKHFKDDDTRVAEAKALQVQLFNSRRAEYNSQVASLNEQISGLSVMLNSRKVQQRSLDEEMTNTRKLAKDGFVPMAQANQAERQKSDIDSSIASTQADIARARLQISQLRSALLKDVDNQLQEIQKNRDAMSSRLDSAKFDRDLAEVKAPVSGSVVGLKVFTVGGVITSGQVLMEVVPKDETLIVQAKIPATIIDKVRVGMATDMRFTAFNQATTPVIPGVMSVVGADKEPGANPNEGEFYMGQVETTKEGLELLGSLKVQPGMPVDVIIKAGERTFMSYLLKPLSDKTARAFKD